MEQETRKKSGCFLPVLIILILILAGILGLSYLQKNGKIEEMVSEFLPINIPFQEVTMEEETFALKFYYGQLAEEEKTSYKEVVQGLLDHSAEIYVHETDAGRTNQLFQYVLKDFPEIFWCDGTATATSYEQIGQNYTVLNPVYQYDEIQTEEKKNEIEAAVNLCLQDISPEASEYDKILYVYEYIVNTVDYDLNSTDNQNIYSVFVNKRSVCAGYSKATQYLLERLGVFCTYVTGTVMGGESHAWNLVTCDGNYYYVDTTWGDPVFQESGGTEEIAGYNNISYDYMCCDDTELFRTHVPDADATFPPCTNMDRNYYVINGMYYTEYNSEVALKAMNDVISSCGNPVVLKYSSPEIYAQAREDIFGNLISRAARNLGEWYGLSQVNYSYVDDDIQNKIVIYWQYS